MNRFFSRGARPKERSKILRRRHATRIVLPRSHFSYREGLLRQFGEPIHQSSRYVVWAVL